jgi:hypothetical protein
MRRTIELVTALLFTFAALADAHAAGGKVAVVAAENFYGDVAQQIGRDQVSVVSILSNPAQDPHLFETTPGVGPFSQSSGGWSWEHCRLSDGPHFRVAQIRPPGHTPS